MVALVGSTQFQALTVDGFFIYDALSENFFGLVGNAYDIVGAVLLARALAFVRPKELERQSTSGYGGFSPPLLKMFAEQKTDSLFGLAFLVFGFALQVLGGYGYKSTNIAFVWTFGLILLVSLVVYFAIRRRLTKAFFVRALNALRDKANKRRYSDDTIDELWSIEDRRFP